MQKLVIFSLLLLLGIPGLIAQTRVVTNPTVAQQSHSDLKVNEIQFFADSTVVFLTITNRLPEGGWFCADRNTYLEDAKHVTRRKLIKANGIPWCPTAHQFTRVGEELNFSLTFPFMPGEPELLNLVEQCDKACFFFKGIILDEKLNRDIRLYDEGTDHYVNNRFDEALEVFTKIVEELPANPTHVYGYSYYNIVRICWQQGNHEVAVTWMKQLEQSGLPNSKYFLDNLRQELPIE
jgi:tetratricopeptide (TPR) repeat protein